VAKGFFLNESHDLSLIQVCSMNSGMKDIFGESKNNKKVTLLFPLLVAAQL